jgi:hypothetical protein
MGKLLDIKQVRETATDTHTHTHTHTQRIINSKTEKPFSSQRKHCLRNKNFKNNLFTSRDVISHYVFFIMDL